VYVLASTGLGAAATCSDRVVLGIHRALASRRADRQVPEPRAQPCIVVGQAAIPDYLRWVLVAAKNRRKLA